jgi:non-ribosomal peptide synthetase component F
MIEGISLVLELSSTTVTCLMGQPLTDDESFPKLLSAIVKVLNKLLVNSPYLVTRTSSNFVEWNETATEYPRDRLIHQLFEEQVERTPMQ